MIELIQTKNKKLEVFKINYFEWSAPEADAHGVFPKIVCGGHCCPFLLSLSQLGMFESLKILELEAICLMKDPEKGSLIEFLRKNTHINELRLKISSCVWAILCDIYL